MCIGFFLVHHLMHFKFGRTYETTLAEDGKKIRDVHRSVLEVFSKKRMVAWYTLAMVAMGIHLREGWQFAPRNLVAQGALPKRFQKEASKVGYRLIAPLCVGFAVCPLYAHFLSSRRKRDEEKEELG